MLPSDIILSNCKKFGWDQDKLISRLIKIFDAKKATHIQENDTLVVVRDIGDNSLEIHVYTMDPPIKFIKSLTKIVSKIKATSVSAVYGKPNNDIVMRAFKIASDRTGIKISPSDKPEYSFKATRA